MMIFLFYFFYVLLAFKKIQCIFSSVLVLFPYILEVSEF